MSGITGKFKAFREVQDGISRLSEEPRDYSLLRTMQLKILSGISDREHAQRRLKAVMKQGQLVAGQESISAVFERVRFERSIWRSCGDAIAHLYLDRFSIKQLYYNVENYSVKQDGGFVSDKDGLEAELAVLDECLRRGAPRILTDITNSIRYGDICVARDGEPYLIEVKSSKGKDSRAKRQIQRLRRLSEFLFNDYSADFRGGEVHRVPTETQIIDHVTELRECATIARRDGSSTISPEEGLFYLCCRESRSTLTDMMAKLPVGEGCLFALNSGKAIMDWQPYRPMQLSLGCQDDFCDFIYNRLLVAVVYDLSVARRVINSAGFECDFRSLDDDVFIMSRHREEDILTMLSSGFFSRIGFEFVSPAWIIQQHLSAPPAEVFSKS